MIETIISIAPYVLLMIAIGLIPSKDKIIKNEVNSFKAETHIAVYILAFFPLLLGFYFIMPFFTEGVGNIIIYLTNAIFLIGISIGICGLNYRNYNIFSEKTASNPIQNMYQNGQIGQDGRVELGSAEVKPIEVEVQQQTYGPGPGKTTGRNVNVYSRTTQPQFQLVECPQCGSAINVNTSIRPMKISCPKCGIEGMVE